jgi:uncharacterized protein
MSKTTSTRSIDVHAHFGTYTVHPTDLVNHWLSSGPERALELAELSGTEYTVVSPLRALFAQGPDDVISGNEEAAKAAENNEGLLQWVVVNPLVQESYVQAAAMLQTPCCVGIKIHPEQHKYHIKDHGRAIFEFAAARQAVVQSHSGCPLTQPVDFVQFADDFPEVKLIVSHLGNNYDEDMTQQVRAVQRSLHGNIFTDTSSSKSITPKLIEWAVNEVGADRILYGTDSPLYFAPMQRARIDCADISDADKQMILRDNALRLFSDKIK